MTLRLTLLASATLLACTSAPVDDTGTGETADPPPTSSAATTTGDPGATTADATTGAPELDPRLAACLQLNACEADGGQPIGLQACLAHALDVPWRWATTGPARLALAAMDCKLAATDCAGVRACTPALDAFADACAASPQGDLCVGDTWVVCDELGAPRVALDCAAAGLACDEDIWAGCGAEACEFGVTEATCDGDTLVECDAAGWLTRVDCPTQYNYVLVNGPEGEQVYSIAGETCGYDEMRGSDGCVGTGDACGFFSQACAGDVLTTCAGGRLAQRDCAAVQPAGQSCGFVQAGAFAGAAACGLVEPACDLGGAETCADGVIGFCDWDAPASLDCRAHGFTGCAGGELAGRAIAWCE
jgi:hypothetical protein